MGKIRENICWNCANACGGCSWSEYKIAKPVPGWTATPIIHKPSAKSKPYVSYHITACPQFVSDKPPNEKKQKRIMTQEIKQQIIDLYIQGLSYKQIEYKIHFTDSAICRFLHANITPEQRQKHNAAAANADRQSKSQKMARNSIVIRLAKSKVPAKEIAEKMDLGLSTVYRIIDNYKLSADNTPKNTDHL